MPDSRAAPVLPPRATIKLPVGLCHASDWRGFRLENISQKRFFFFLNVDSDLKSGSVTPHVFTDIWGNLGLVERVGFLPLVLQMVRIHP